MAMIAPVTDGGCEPVYAGIVELKPWDSQNERIRRSGNDEKLCVHDGYWRELTSGVSSCVTSASSLPSTECTSSGVDSS